MYVFVHQRALKSLFFYCKMFSTYLGQYSVITKFKHP